MANGRSPTVRMVVLGLIAVVLFTGFAALGTWQVQRRAWKLNLIETVNQRVHAEPRAVPGRDDWPRIDAVNNTYRHVYASGHFLHEHTFLVHASSYLGYGYWMLTPLRTSAGSIVFINRGFLPADLPHSEQYQQVNRPQGRVRIHGLLRLNEPKGTFLRSNKPSQGRWYSRDVVAMAQSAEFAADNVAPYFIDADADQHAGKYPVGGQTVISFRNSHLVYALTWYTLAGLTLVGAGIVIRYEWRVRSRQ